jgi:hypothetical protein
MSDSEKSFIEHFRKQVINIAVAYGFVMLFSAVGFYYTTSTNLDNAAKERLEIKSNSTEVEAQIYELNRIKIDKKDVIREFDEIKGMLNNLDTKLERIK